MVRALHSSWVYFDLGLGDDRKNLLPSLPTSYGRPFLSSFTLSPMSLREMIPSPAVPFDMWSIDGTCSSLTNTDTSSWSTTMAETWNLLYKIGASATFCCKGASFAAFGHRGCSKCLLTWGETMGTSMRSWVRSYPQGLPHHVSYVNDPGHTRVRSRNNLVLPWHTGNTGNNSPPVHLRTMSQEVRDRCWSSSTPNPRDDTMCSQQRLLSMPCSPAHCPEPLPDAPSLLWDRPVIISGTFDHLMAYKSLRRLGGSVGINPPARPLFLSTSAPRTTPPTPWLPPMLNGYRLTAHYGTLDALV